MATKLLVFLFIIVAIIAGVLVEVVPTQDIVDVMRFIRFFDVMLPILAVGALLKFLMKGVND